MLGFTLAACDNGAPGEKKAAPVPAPNEKIGVEDAESKETITVRGLLRHLPQDVKSTEAWLGHEFMVGDKPIRPAEAITRDELMNMVGETVEVEGLWNAGKKWEPPKPTEEGFSLQRPSYPEGVIVIRRSGVEATSVKKVE